MYSDIGTGREKAGISVVGVRMRANDLGQSNAKQHATFTSTKVVVGRIMVHSIQMIVT